MGDDGVGLEAAARLAPIFAEQVDIEKSAESGLRLMEILEGYHKVLILDSVATAQHPPGTILRFTKDNFAKVAAPSPHYAGMPEIFQLADRLGIPFPEEIIILAMEIKPSNEFKEGLSQAVAKALPNFVTQAKQIILQWKQAQEINSNNQETRYK